MFAVVIQGDLQVPDFMRARQGSGSTSPSERGSPQVYRNVFSELSNLIRSTHSTLLTVLLDRLSLIGRRVVTTETMRHPSKCLLL